MVGWFPGETCGSPCPAPNPTPVLAHPAGVHLCSHRYLHPSPMKQQPAGRAAAGEHHPIPTLSQQPTPQRSIIPTLQSRHSSRSQTLCAGTLTCRASKSQQRFSLTQGAPRAGTAQLLEGDTARCFLLHWAFSKQPAALDRRALIEPIPCSSCLCRAVPRVQGTSPYPKELLTPATMRPLKSIFSDCRWVLSPGAQHGTQAAICQRHPCPLPPGEPSDHAACTHGFSKNNF